MLFKKNKKQEQKQKPAKSTTQIGRTAENRAADYLQGQGFNILTQNFSAKTGEIDIIAQDNNTLLFVEVKFRKSAQFGQPYETVTRSKQQKIIRTAQYFLLMNKKYANNACRFDVISILNDEITWLQHAFE